MSDTPAVQKVPLQVQSSGSSHILMPLRQPYMSESFASKRVFFYKSGDAQFNGLPVVISNRTFKTFEGLLDSLSKRVPLPFGVRTITTPRGHTAVQSLDQLHHGHSYICSDKRTVKPIDLEQARRKPPPWYHARPVSSRRLASTRIGTQGTRRNEHACKLHTPKRLIVFRNGDPEVKHSLLLHKRNTQSFEALVNLISEVMSFPVHKLYTPDGRRVDGLPALILCSGVLIAAGREPFRKGNYDVQKPCPPTWLPVKSMRRVHQLNHCYIANQTPNNSYKNAPTGSVDLENGQQLESVAVDTTACINGDTQEDMYIPTDEDIEKSFRVNEDGSMTVEMKVRLTLKDEETVHWTTTLSRSSVVNQMKSVLELLPDTGALLSDKIPPGVEPEVLTHGDVSTRESLQAVHKEVEKSREGTLGQVKADAKQMSFEKKNTEAETDGQENMLGSYIYKEEEQLTHEHCMVRLHPIPKPRRNTVPPELCISEQSLQLKGKGEEALNHIFQQQACQTNTGNQELTNTAFPEFSNMVPIPSKDLYSEARPSAVYGSHPREVKSKLLNLQKSFKGPITHVIRDKKSGKQTPLKDLPKSSATKMISAAGSTKKRKPVRIILKKSHIFRTATIEYNRKDNKMNILKEIQKIRADIFNRAGVMRAMTKYYQFKVVQELLKRRAYLASGHKCVSATLHNTVQLKIQNTNQLLNEKTQSINQQKPAIADTPQEKLKVSSASVSKNQLHTSTNKCSLKRQTLVQDEQEFQQERQEITSIPALNSASPVFNEYVKPWLQKSEPVLYKKVPPPKSNTFPHLPKISCGSLDTRQALDGDLKCYVSLDSILSHRNVSLPNPEMKQEINKSLSPMAETVISNPSPERKGVFKSKETLTLDKCSVETMTPQSNTAGHILPRNLSLMHNPWNQSEEHKLSLTKNPSEKEKIPNVFQDVKQLSIYADVEKKGLTRHTILDSNTTTIKVSESKLSTNPEKTGNEHVKSIPFTRNTSLEKTLLSQNSTEEIPQYNTLANASLFKNRIVEKSQILNSEITDGSQSSKILLVKLQPSSDTMETTENVSLKTLQAENSFTVKMAVRPDMRHVLDELCNSINLLHEVTQHKQRSYIDKFNSMPDLSSHLASTFGSSSRVLLAFLTVRILKDGLENINLHHQAKNHLNCSEAFLMMRSLVEMAAIEDAERLRMSLKALYNSASNQLKQSWRGFQELTNRFMIPNVTPECVGSRSYSGPYSEKTIQGLMEKLGVPDKVREALSVFHAQEECISGNRLGESKMCEFPNSVLEEDVNMYVKSVIEKALNAHLVECHNSLVRFKNKIQVDTGDPERYFCPIMTKEQSNSVLDHGNHVDTSLSKFVLDDKQKRVEKRGVRVTESGMEYLIHEGELQSKNKHIENMNGKKGRVTCKKSAEKRILKTRINENRSVEEDYIMEALHNTEITKETQHLRKAMQTNEGMTTVKGTNAYELSNSEERLTPSDDEKSSLEEEESCDEECMNFSEYQISDKEERLQMTVTATVSSIDQKKTIHELQGKLKNEQLVNQAIHSNTCSLKEDSGPTEMHTGLLAVHAQSQMKEDEKQEFKSISDEEPVVVEVPESNTIYHKHIADKTPYSPIGEALCEENALHFSKMNNNTVAGLICNLELAAQKINCKNVRRENTSMPHMELSANYSSTCNRSHLDSTSEVPSSSLVFSYDSQSSSLAQEPERMVEVNRVKSIREMFLARSSSTTQNGQRRLHSPNSDQSDYQSECRNSGEIWTQTSPETSTVDDDSSRLAIAKGFVKRTIERLYGRGNLNITGPDDMIPQSASNRKQKEFPGRTSVSALASFHEARTQVMTDLSYFSATSSLDVYSEPANCITLDEQLGPGDIDHSDKGHLEKEKDKTILMQPSTDSSGTKCAYFNLPNASDSELELVEQKVKTLKKTDVKLASDIETTKSWIEKKSVLPAFSPPVFMKIDNKVHPLTDATTSPVVTQPVGEQSAQTRMIRHSTEPDALEMVFVFCGQHCPIL